MKRAPRKKRTAPISVQKAHLTEPRRKVLAIMSQKSKPLTAYEVLDLMPEGTKPPTVYRALDFWEREGIIHKISSLNQYVMCHAHHQHDGGQFLICRQCRAVTEAHICAMPEAISRAAAEKKFQVSGWSLELYGLCKNCRNLTAGASEFLDCRA